MRADRCEPIRQQRKKGCRGCLIDLPTVLVVVAATAQSCPGYLSSVNPYHELTEPVDDLADGVP